MIVSDEYRFFFVHIPKCAGSSVRQHLQKFDDRNGFYTGVSWLSELGQTDLRHMPLFVIKDQFPKEFANLHNYWSFAIIRNPFQRFASSLTQRLRMYGHQPLQKLSISEIKCEIAQAIGHLGRLPRDNHLLSPQFIHFQRQIDFVNLDGHRTVQSLYRVDEINRLLDDVNRRTGGDLESLDNPDLSPKNLSLAHRSEFLRRLVEALRPATRAIVRTLPESAKERMRALVYVPRDQRLGELFRAGHVRDFVEDYYREDIALWETVGGAAKEVTLSALQARRANRASSGEAEGRA